MDGPQSPVIMPPRGDYGCCESPIFTNKTAFVAILVSMCCFPAVIPIRSMGLTLNTQLVLRLRYSQP
jgi:hypothetical protein